MTLLPVTVTVAGSMFSARRLAALAGVGARCRDVSCVVRRRLISSGKGE
jgi:hypothetical protein